MELLFRPPLARFFLGPSCMVISASLLRLCSTRSRIVYIRVAASLCCLRRYKANLQAYHEHVPYCLVFVVLIQLSMTCARCIPYRLKQSGDCTTNLEEGLEVLMISSPNRSDLVFPKGGWELDETLQEAACREAYEEAGIRGIIHGKRLGPWVSRSKSSESSCSLEGSCRCYMYALEVTEEVDSWPEQVSHERRWLPVPEARALCRYKWMEEALEEFLECQDAAISSSSSSFHGKPSEPESISSTNLPTVVGRVVQLASILDLGNVFCSESGLQISL